MKNFIKEIRKAQGLSGDELAAKCNTTPQQINFLENGKRKLTWDWMQRIAAALECHPVDLVEGPASAPAAKDEKERELLKAYRGLADGERQIFSHMLDGLAKGKNKETPEDPADARAKKKQGD